MTAATTKTTWVSFKDIAFKKRSYVAKTSLGRTYEADGFMSINWTQQPTTT